MTQIKLNYEAAIGIANKMKSDASSFGSNHQKLIKTVADLGAVWTGDISSTMQSELKDMNKDVGKIQEALEGLAEIAIQSANALKETDDAIGAGIGGIA